MRHILSSLACIALLSACSVDRYTLSGRVVADPRAGVESMRPGKAEKLAARPVQGAMVRLVVDPDDALHRKELGVFACDADGRFTVPGLDAPGVELVPYALRIEAYAPRFAPLRLDTGLPGPGHALVLRMAPSDEPTPQGFAPAPAGSRQSADDYLRNTLKDGEPYLNGGK